jgi:enterochelin esterase-like enzyme
MFERILRSPHEQRWLRWLHPMNTPLRLTLACLLGFTSVFGADASAPAAARKPGEYEHGPDSKPQEGVPKGRLEGPFEFRSQIIANTVRQYWLYVPAQYVADKPACLLVFQDGNRATNPAPNASLRVPQVMENLIHKKDMPVTIGLFITPGQRGDTYPATIGTNNPNNRAQEYDAVNDTYARFLIQEMIPEVKKKYNITDDPDGRVIGGTSSGAICAFTVAWFHPEAFHKVISMIGSYTSIGYRPARDGQPAVSGGEIYPTWIRREPPKPIRIFLQDGSNDLSNSQSNPLFSDGTTLSNQFGNWHLANQQMLSALEYANRVARGNGPRYDINHVWGDGNHSDLHGGTLLPDILRWMFRDWPKP